MSSNVRSGGSGANFHPLCDHCLFLVGIMKIPVAEDLQNGCILYKTITNIAQHSGSLRSSMIFLFAKFQAKRIRYGNETWR